MTASVINYDYRITYSVRNDTFSIYDHNYQKVASRIPTLEEAERRVRLACGDNASKCVVKGTVYYKS